ncbi:MAG: nucleoside triphosphate pyrophosphohydrolase, partial [Bacteroidales bacterium]|nr:nucleoside triphosphate pyrophosphohydrolase [Bacteroidales bacterium]
VGFDWEKKEDVWDKVAEELGELRAELSGDSKERQEAELGDFIFSVVNAARLYHLNPDTALERTNAKFKRRFTYLELRAKELGRDLNEMTLAEMDALWDEAKTKESAE